MWQRDLQTEAICGPTQLKTHSFTDFRVAHHTTLLITKGRSYVHLYIIKLWTSGSRQSCRMNSCIIQIINVQQWDMLSHRFVMEGLWHLSAQVSIACRITFPSCSLSYCSTQITPSHLSLHLQVPSSSFFWSTSLQCPQGSGVRGRSQVYTTDASISFRGHSFTSLNKAESVNGGSWAVTMFPPVVHHTGRRRWL